AEQEIRNRERRKDQDDDGHKYAARTAPGLDEVRAPVRNCSVAGGEHEYESGAATREQNRFGDSRHFSENHKPKTAPIGGERDGCVDSGEQPMRRSGAEVLA